MFGLWKSKKQRQEEEARAAAKDDLKAIVTEDLLGASDWKESKVGYLTGLSSVGRIGQSVATNLAQSFGRIGLLFSFLSKSDDLPSLPDVAPDEYDGRKRFEDAARLHRRNERDVRVAMKNTRRSTYLYAGIASVAILYFCYALASRETIPLTTLALHLTPIIVFPTLAFKAAYYNWMFRNRSLQPPAVFIRSGEWLPKA